MLVLNLSFSYTNSQLYNIKDKEGDEFSTIFEEDLLSNEILKDLSDYFTIFKQNYSNATLFQENKETNKTYLNNVNVTDISSIPELKDHHDSWICKMCLKSTAYIQKIADKKYGLKLLKKLATKICEKEVKLEKEVCEGAVDLYGDSLVEGVIYKYLSPQYLCTKNKLCQPHYKVLNHTEYAENLLKEKRIYHNETKSDQDTQIIAQVSDIHLDLLYKEGSNGECGLPLCCRNEEDLHFEYKNNSMLNVNNQMSYLEDITKEIRTSEIKDNSNEVLQTPLGFLQSNKNANYDLKSKLAGKYGYLGDCDIPIITVDSLFEDLFTKKPEIVMLTGDNVAHDTWKTTLDAALNATSAIVSSVMKYKTHDSIVYPTLGNHESKVVDNVDFHNKTFLKEFNSKYAEVYKPFLEHDQQAYDTFKKNGYYTTKHKDTDLRIVSLNSYNCDVLNFYLMKNVTDPGNQFTWLEEVLRQAEKNNEIVYIIGHIFPYNSFYLSECLYVYQAIVDRFSHIIKSQMFGHSHSDELLSMTSYFDKNNITSLLYVAPSATSYNGKNPSYRMYSYNTTSLDLLNYSQMRLDLSKANKEGKTSWKLAYNFNELYDHNCSDYEGIKKKMNTLVEDLDFTRKVWHEHSSGRVNTSKAKDEEVKRRGSNYLCNFNMDDKSENCKRPMSQTRKVYKVLEYFYGSWYAMLDD